MSKGSTVRRTRTGKAYTKKDGPYETDFSALKERCQDIFSRVPVSSERTRVRW